MPRTTRATGSTTPAQSTTTAPRARRGQRQQGSTPAPAAPALAPVLDADVQERISDIRAHAAACGRIDCGHLSKSASLPTRRACMLYVLAGAGCTIDLDRETPEVAAIYGVLTSTEHARPYYGGEGTPLPDANGIRITPERLAVFTAMVQGMSASQISQRQGRARATVQSHAGYLRRLTGAHDATSALVSLLLAGKLTDASVTVPALPEVAA